MPLPPTPPEPPEPDCLRRWYACYTQPRHERKVAQRLLRHEIESFLPLIPQRRQWSDRSKIVFMPMFPGYVFGRFAPCELHDVLLIQGIVTVVHSGGRPAPLPEQDIENARRLSIALRAGDVDVEPEVFVEHGQRVTIVDGPFHGVEGVVIERRGRWRVLVGIRTIGQAVALDLRAGALKPVLLGDTLPLTEALLGADDGARREATNPHRVSRPRTA